VAQCEAGNRLYQKGQQLLKKMQAKRAQKPNDCTFVPKVTKKAQATSSVDGGENRFEKLYNQAKSKKSAAVKGEHGLAASATATTTAASAPANAQPKKKPTASTASAGSAGSAASSARFDKLYNDASRSRSKLEGQRARAETEGCTFAPKITSKGKRSASPACRKRFEQLYDKADAQKSAADRAAQKSAAELRDCTFKPKINAPSSSSSARASSVPKGRPSSAPGGGGGGGVGSVPACVDRLVNAGKATEAKKQQLREHREREDGKSLTFQPNCRSAHRQSIGGAASAPKSAVSGDVFERLAAAKTKTGTGTGAGTASTAAPQAGAVERLPTGEAECTFRPKLNSRSASLGGGGKQAGGGGSIFDRLHSQDAKIRATKAANEDMKVRARKAAPVAMKTTLADSRACQGWGRSGLVRLAPPHSSPASRECAPAFCMLPT
jgi:hypothetical protein